MCGVAMAASRGAKPRPGLGAVHLERAYRWWAANLSTGIGLSPTAKGVRYAAHRMGGAYRLERDRAVAGEPMLRLGIVRKRQLDGRRQHPPVDASKSQSASISPAAW